MRRRLLSAYFLTDGAFAVALTGGRIRLPGLLGAGMSMFVAWNAGTLIGASAGGTLPDLTPLGVDFVAPLTFVPVTTLTALTVSSIAARPDQGAIRFVAALVAWRTHTVWLRIVVGISFYWLLRFV